MKRLFTYISLIICISANAQGSDKVNEIDKQLIEVQTQWRNDVDASIRQLRSEVNNLKSKLNSQSDIITQLKIDDLLDSLKIDRLEKQINYTQSFIKDSVVFVVDIPAPVDNNLIDNYDNYNNAWNIDNNSYIYNATVDNYAYLFFNLKEDISPNSTYIISFTVQLEDTNKEALINFWFYDNTSNERLSDTYYVNGNHSFDYTPTKDRSRMSIRARNNNGGSFKLSNLKLVEK